VYAPSEVPGRRQPSAVPEVPEGQRGSAVAAAEQVGGERAVTGSNVEADIGMGDGLREVLKQESHGGEMNGSANGGKV